MPKKEPDAYISKKRKIVAGDNRNFSDDTSTTDTIFTFLRKPILPRQKSTVLTSRSPTIEGEVSPPFHKTQCQNSCQEATLSKKDVHNSSHFSTSNPSEYLGPYLGTTSCLGMRQQAFSQTHESGATAPYSNMGQGQSSTEVAAKYQYRPLQDPRSIRLVEVLPGATGETVHISLHHSNLSALASCSAVSYAWGSTTRDHLIFCDETTVAVTSSLHFLLEKLRGSQESQLLWIDAICINQDDLEERSQQVSLMREIYRMAHTVLIWIGDQDENTANALPVITKLAGLVDTLPFGEETFGSFQQFEELSDFPTSVEWLDDAVNHLSWNGVVDILTSRKYFLRLWIIQEIVLSSNPLVLCGTHRISWHYIHKAALVVWSCKFLQNRIVDPEILSKVMTLGWVSSSDMSHRSLSFILAAFPTSEAWDPRDRVYGLLGLITSGEQQTSLSVDYTKSVERVFQDATESVILWEGSLLSLMTQCCDPLSRPWNSMPSWVVPLEPRLARFTPAAVPLLEWMIKHKDRMVLAGDVLTGYGLIIDTIEFVTENLSETNMATHVLGVFDRYATEDVDVDIDITEAARNTFLAVNAYGPGLAIEEDDFFCLLSSWIILRYRPIPNEIAQNPTVPPTSARSPKANEDVEEPKVHADPLPREVNIAKWALSHADTNRLADIASDFKYEVLDMKTGLGRNIFRSSIGCVGVGPLGWNKENSPPAVQTGDSLALIHTVPTPMILRLREDGAYTVVGSAHVGNLLDMDLFKSGVLPELEPLRFR
ncbi:hypothetical protein IFR05_006416 [Cadophora sp. M221]|nr:hypothetical protein IFR05_006416 [Cadophora sp. M221]